MKLARHLWLVCLILLARPLAGQAVAADGVLIANWGDPQSLTGRPRLVWVHRDNSGVERLLNISPSVLREAGGYFAVNGKNVRISATRRISPTDGGATWEAQSLRPQLQNVQAAGAPLGAPQFGSKPYAVLLCKFPDVAAEPTNITAMTTVHSGAYPGLDHYWREASTGQMNTAGTEVFGWFTLPQPKATYMNGSSPKFSELAAACANAADAQVDFSRFFGIHAQFNAFLTSDNSAGMAWGGGSFMTLDGQSRSWPFTWMPTWAAEGSRYGVYAHETGHSLGLPHSSGPYGEVYDSSWDVMSNSYLRWTGSYYVPGHTIAPHKNFVGWIPAQRRRVVTTEETFTLERSAFPSGSSNPMLAEVAIPGSTAKYAIEARHLIGYDQYLPGEGVIIHRLGGSCSPLCATVVDGDGNGDPNDAGAMWRAGETFVGEGGVRVTINARTEYGWNITVTPNITTTQCTLTLAQTSGGTISVASGSVTGVCGRTVTVQATPESEHVFRSWSNGVSSATQTVTMTQSTTLSALFVRQCSLSLAQTTGGTIAQTGGTAGGDCGRSVTVAAVANGGYLFRAWSTGATANPNAFALNQTTAMSALFVQQCGLVLVQATGGTIALSDGQTAGDCGRNVTVAASAASGFVFLEWSDGDANSSRLLRVTEISHSISAAFADVSGLAGRIAGLLLGSASAGPSPAEARYLDASGNRNGSQDLGDLLALLDRFPGAQFSASTMKQLTEAATLKAVSVPAKSNNR